MIDYIPGTPTWVDLHSPDVDTSKAFYGELFGWTANEGNSSGSWTFSSAGKLTSALTPSQGALISPQWITCVSSDNEVQTVNRALAASGKVLLETKQGVAKRLIVLQDPVGAVFGVFQHDRFAGAHLFNQPVSLTFNLLMTRQPDLAKHFYAKVFGWEPRDRDMGNGFAFTYFFHGGRGVAGLMAMNERWPQTVPSHWQTSFSVEDAAVLAARAIELGGKAQPVTDTPFGRSALLTDPQGATFSVSQQTPDVRAAAQTPAGVLPHLV